MSFAACDTLERLRGTSDEAPAEPVGAATETLPDAAATLAYEAKIIGVEDDALRALLEGSAQVMRLKDQPVATLGALRRRAEGDVESLQVALRSEGYYAAEVGFDIVSDAAPPKVIVTVSTGPRYSLAAYDIVYEGPPPPVRAKLEDLGLSIGMPARAPEIAAAQVRLLDDLARRGYPLAAVRDRKTTVDHGASTMTVVLRVDPGAGAVFGPVTISGLQNVDESYVRELLNWREGEPYDGDAVASSRDALAASGLFASAEIAPATAVDSAGRLPVAVNLVEGKHRSLGFGADYSTSEGFGGEIFWEHRNLLGRNETLRLSLTAAEIEQSLAARGRKPRFLRPDQALVAEAALNNRNTEAFDEQSVTSGVGLERSLGENWQVSAGVSGEYSVLTDDGGRETFQLLGLPLGGWRDTTDNPLNPTEGTRLNLNLTPYGGSGDDALLFAVASASGSIYEALDSDGRFVLAGRLKLGSLAGAETASVPANKRFYAGGGGSVRGFAFQSVGPLDAKLDPLGGRSLIEFNGELRAQVSESIGLVPFIDGGSVFDASYPDFGETIRWAAGLGVRYFTDIGPLRLDVAVPINKRSSDDSFQFYISIGQAF